MKKYTFTLAFLALAIAQNAHAVFSLTDSGDYVYINEYVGATAFYDIGITGQNVEVANIELHAPDPYYSGLLQGDNYEVHSYLMDEDNEGLSTDDHSAGTLGIMAAYVEDSEYQELITGIANGAYYYAQAFIESPSEEGDSYVERNSDTIRIYKTYFESDIDVISSSWCLPVISDSTAKMGLVFDSLAFENPTTTFVAAAGNYGEDGEGYVYAPYYSNQNVIAVGSLSSDSDFTEVSSFSSYGPNDFYNPITGETISGVVSSIDIVAPGEDIIFYLSEDNQYYLANGTSLAAPVVSGVVALMKSYSYEYGLSTDTLDSRLVKAVLLNSATRLDNWDNGQYINENGVIVTTQSLDYQLGAGIVDAEQALAEYSKYGMTSTLETVYFEGYIDFEFTVYDISADLSVTLCWFVNASYDEDSLEFDNETYSNFEYLLDVDLSDSSFGNLDLEIWGIDEFDEEYLVATSMSEYNNVELLYIALEEGDYFIRVTFYEMIYGEQESETFGLAWNLSSSSTVPEPSTYAIIIGLFSLGFVAYKRRK